MLKRSLALLVLKLKAVREIAGFFEWSLVRRSAWPIEEWTSCELRLDPAVALARIVTFKMLEDKALI